MNQGLLLTFFVCTFTCAATFAVTPDPLPPTDPCDIISIVSRVTIPRIKIDDSILREALDFINGRHRKVETNPSLATNYVFDFRLPDATLQRRISFEARDVTVIQAIKLALAAADTPVTLTFEPGKLIIHPLPAPADAPASTRRP